MVPSLQAPPDLAHPDRKTIRSLFNAISQKYDFLNSFLSLGLHHYWRYRLVQLALSGLERRILDLGVGTGKSLGRFLKAHRFEQAVGCDFSEAMLKKAQRRLGNQATLMVSDFHELPFPSESFDLATGSFILRSVQDMTLFLSETRRVLEPGGKVVFLELTLPRNQWFQNWFYKPYLKFWVPSVGQWFTKHDHAYQFLSHSIQEFATPEELKSKFEHAGFSDVLFKPLTFGIVTIIQARVGSS